MSESDRSFLIRLAAIVLAVSVLVTLGVLLVGLFYIQIDNDKIFAILGPSYATIVGSMVTLLATGRSSK